MENLHKQLLPNVRFGLNKNKVKYKHVIKHLVAKLHVYNSYSEMTIDEVRTLISFSDTNTQNWTTFDWKWGDKLFKYEKNELN